MSLLPNATYYGPNQPQFIPINGKVSTLAVSSFTANTINAVSTFTSNLLAGYSETTEAFIYDVLTIDNQTLTANNTALLLNGVPIATIANLSSIADWSLYPQTSTVQGNNKSTIGLSYLSASTIGAVSLSASNIFTQNLMAFNIVNFTSTVIDVYESTIQADIKLANISTANISNLYVSTANFSTLNSINATVSNLTAGTASVNTLTGTSASFCNFVASSITVSSIVSPPVTAGSFSSLTVVSNTNTGSLTVGSNNITTFASAPVFSDGGNFNGTRPNFNTGINTIGPNNFNNTNLDNVGRITAGNVFVGSPGSITLQASTQTTILNDRQADVGGNSVINLTAQYGGATQVNITAGQASAYAVTPTSQVNITANGSTSLSQNGIGGKISLVANAGSGVNCNILAFGEVDITAYSSLPFAGVIKESAGSILAYSGLTSPLVGVYGYSYYSALNCLSLTAGLTTPSGSYPGVVYLRGDNGTKVVNGFYADTANVSGTTTTSNIVTNSVNSFSGQGITIQAPVNNINFIASTATFQCGIAGNFSVPSIINLSSINGAPYIPGGGGGSVVSSFTNLATSSFMVSSINNAVYPPPGGGSFVSTATSDLNMNNFNITSPANLNINTQYLHLNGSAEIISKTLSTGLSLYSNLVNLSVDSNATGLTLYSFPGGTGASLFSDRPLSLFSGNNSGAYTSQTFTSTSIDFLQTGGSGYIRRNASGNIIDTAVGNIQTQATSTINTVTSTWFSGGITRQLVSANIPQPIIQYGITSTTGSAGTIIQNLPNRYTSQTSYQIFANYIDGPPAPIAVSSISRGAFALSFLGAGGGTQTVSYMTVGT